MDPTRYILFWGLCSRGGTLWKSMRMVVRPFVESRGRHIYFWEFIRNCLWCYLQWDIRNPNAERFEQKICTSKYDPGIQNSLHWACGKGSPRPSFIKRPNIQLWETGDRVLKVSLGWDDKPTPVSEGGWSYSEDQTSVDYPPNHQYSSEARTPKCLSQYKPWPRPLEPPGSYMCSSCSFFYCSYMAVWLSIDILDIHAVFRFV